MTDVKPLSTHLILYPEGPHPMQTIFEEVEKRHLAQDSVLLKSPEMKPLPLHELLGYQRVLMSLCIPSGMSCTGYGLRYTYCKLLTYSLLRAKR